MEKDIGTWLRGMTESSSPTEAVHVSAVEAPMHNAAANVRTQLTRVVYGIIYRYARLLKRARRQQSQRADFCQWRMGSWANHSQNFEHRVLERSSRVEDLLSQPTSITRLLGCFVHAKVNSFENLLDPFLKICRLSSLVVIAISSTHPFFQKLAERLNHSKAVVRLNLLRLLRIICEASPERVAIVERYGFLGIVRQLREKDSAVLVKEMAGDLLPALVSGGPSGNILKPTVEQPPFSRSTVLRRKVPRRSTSEATNDSSIPLSSLRTRQLKPKSIDAGRMGPQ